jgi:hypothetical protein
VIVLLSTDIRISRFETGTGPLADSLVRAAADAGAEGVHVGAGVLLPDLAALAAVVLRAGLEVSAVALPLADRAPGPGKRLPHLGAADVDERASALDQAGKSMAAGAAMGVARAVLDLGPVALPVSRAEVARFFARRELDEDDPGAARLETALAARKASAPRLLDACHWSLERLCRAAEARGMTLLLPAGGSPWELPSPREALSLLEAFRGAPLALLWDPGRLSVVRALGLSLSDQGRQALSDAAGAALENDAVGLDAGYLPGLGDRGPGLTDAPQLPAGAPVIITGGRDATDAEVATAVARTRASYARATAARSAETASSTG